MTTKRLGIVAAAVLSVLTGLAGASSASAGDMSERRIATTAQVLAGIQPASGDPVIDRLTKLDAFIEHQRWMTDQWTLVGSRITAMQDWGAREIKIVGAERQTLLYPFSGPDFLNAYALFPHHAQYRFFFSLERPGQLPDLTSMTPAQFALLLQEVREAFRDIFERNYFITDYMNRQLTTPELRGTVPVMAAMMALMRLNVVRIEPLDLFPDLTRTYEAAQVGHGPHRIMRGVRIDFVKAGGGAPQQLYYIAVDATDKQLGFYPGFLEWVAKHRPAAVMIKSASYLLHEPQFVKTRDMILSTADFVLQDDTGVPYHLLARPWHIRLYGRYVRPTMRGLRFGYQADLEAAYKAQADLPELPFPFGYNWKGKDAGLLIASR